MEGGINWLFELERIIKDNNKDEIEEFKLHLRSMFKVSIEQVNDIYTLKMGINDNYCRSYYTFENDKIVSKQISYIKSSPKSNNKYFNDTKKNTCDLIINNCISILRKSGAINEEGVFVNLMEGEKALSKTKNGDTVDLTMLHESNLLELSSNKDIIVGLDNIIKTQNKVNKKIYSLLKKKDTNALKIMFDSIMDNFVNLEIECLKSSIKNMKSPKKKQLTKKSTSQKTQLTKKSTSQKTSKMPDLQINPKQNTQKGGIPGANLIAGLTIPTAGAMGMMVYDRAFNHLRNTALKQAVTATITKLFGENFIVMTQNTGTYIFNGIISIVVLILYILNMSLSPFIYLFNRIRGKKQNINLLKLKEVFNFRPTLNDKFKDKFTITIANDIEGTEGNYSYDKSIYVCDLLEYIKKIIHYNLSKEFQDHTITIKTNDMYCNGKFITSKDINMHQKMNRLVLRIGIKPIFTVTIKKHYKSKTIYISCLDIDIIKLIENLEKLKTNRNPDTIDWNKFNDNNIDKSMFNQPIIETESIAKISILESKDYSIFNSESLYKKLNLHLSNFPLFTRTIFDYQDINYLDNNNPRNDNNNNTFHTADNFGIGSRVNELNGGQYAGFNIRNIFRRNRRQQTTPLIRQSTQTRRSRDKRASIKKSQKNIFNRMFIKKIIKQKVHREDTESYNFNINEKTVNIRYITDYRLLNAFNNAKLFLENKYIAYKNYKV